MNTTAETAANRTALHGASDDTMRLSAIAVYVLYLLALPLGITAFVGVILAYVCRGDAMGTPFESHFDNAISIFWVFFAAMFVIVPLCFVLVGLPLLAALYVWMIYRTVKGLMQVWDARPYVGR